MAEKEKPKPKPPDKRTELRELGKKLGEAFVEELLAQKAHQDADKVRHGARTPSGEDHAVIRAAKQFWLKCSRKRLAVIMEMENLLGIVQTPTKPPGEALDELPG